MRKIGMVFVALALTGVAASTAFAQKEKEEKAKVKVFDFTADEITGDLIKPEGTGVDATVFGQYGSLIRIRKEFIAEILKSAEDL